MCFKKKDPDVIEKMSFEQERLFVYNKNKRSVWRGMLLLWYETISEDEKKTYIKRIEFHLRNWKNYKAAVLNLERRMEKDEKGGHVKETEAYYQIGAEKKLYQFLLDSMETALAELDETERALVEYRYIHNWSMGKCAMEIGYSEKTLFLLKKALLDKLLVSLAAITNI